MNNCRLCSDLRTQHEPWNEPLFESQNFVGLPSLGALVEGWLLLVPKEHFICMGSLPKSVTSEMRDMKQEICSTLEELYGPVCTFEHGPSRKDGSLGCGVDHAHLHVVPITFDLHADVTPFLPSDVTWSTAGPEQCRYAFDQGKDYLYLEQPIGRGRIATHDSFGSQLFRRAIATRIEEQDHFNWREFPILQNVFATIKKVSAKRAVSLQMEAAVAA